MARLPSTRKATAPPAAFSTSAPMRRGVSSRAPFPPIRSQIRRATRKTSAARRWSVPGTEHAAGTLEPSWTGPQSTSTSGGPGSGPRSGRRLPGAGRPLAARCLPGLPVADLGCGPGAYVDELAGAGPVVAVDAAAPCWLSPGGLGPCWCRPTSRPRPSGTEPGRGVGVELLPPRGPAPTAAGTGPPALGHGRRRPADHLRRGRRRRGRVAGRRLPRPLLHLLAARPSWPACWPAPASRSRAPRSTASGSGPTPGGPGPFLTRWSRHAGAGLRAQPERGRRRRRLRLRRPTNRFWKAAVAAGLLTHPRDPLACLVHDRVGMTDLVKRATPNAAALSRRGVPGRRRAGPPAGRHGCSPGSCCSSAWPAGGRPSTTKAAAGLQPEPFAGVPAYVMPSTSGLNAHSRAAELAAHMADALARLTPA